MVGKDHKRRATTTPRLTPPPPTRRTTTAELISKEESEGTSQLNVHKQNDGVQPKENPHSSSTFTDTSSNHNSSGTSGSPEKRKYENGNRRFSRFFRTSSPGKRSPTKKARMERRRSTGTMDKPRISNGTASSVPNAAAAGGGGGGGRGLIFVRKNASLGNESGQNPTSEAASNTAAVMGRRRSLFRRKRIKDPVTNPGGYLSVNNELEPERGDERVQEKTHIIAVRSQSPRAVQQEEKKEEEREPSVSEIPDTERTGGNSIFCQSTEIFQHSYLETLCGGHGAYDDSSVHNEEPMQDARHISDDPTVQESIECVFSNRLEEDIARMLQIDDDEDEDDTMLDDPPTAPSHFHQSVLRTRSDLLLSSPPGTRAKKRMESVKLAHLGSLRQGQSEQLVATYQDTQPLTPKECPVRVIPDCACTQQQTPQLDISLWPQAPLLLRPTPGSGTRATRIRLIGSSDNDGIVLWEAGQQSNETWWQALHKHWGRTEEGSADIATVYGCKMCPKCMVLPINNGNEDAGETLVTDFESDLFVGTLLIRLRYSNGTTKVPYRDDRGYFTGMNRRYQTVIRGRFKESMSWTECRTGLVLDRPAGKLPAKWILKGGIKVLSFFAPHLEVKLDSARPTSLTPLGSTPQVLAVHNPDESYDIETTQEEPTTGSHCLLGDASPAPSSLQRARRRKKSFDKLYAQRASEPRVDPSKVYTFEFLQHLFNFQDFTIELGSMLGSVPLAPMLNGQALPIMACNKDVDRRLWSFDVWHESLVSK
jgi:hypothetical protein